MIYSYLTKCPITSGKTIGLFNINNHLDGIILIYDVLGDNKRLINEDQFHIYKSIFNSLLDLNNIYIEYDLFFELFDEFLIDDFFKFQKQVQFAYDVYSLMINKNFQTFTDSIIRSTIGKNNVVNFNDENLRLIFLRNQELIDNYIYSVLFRKLLTICNLCDDNQEYKIKINEIIKKYKK